MRGRLGYLFTPTLLAYGTGGLAYGRVSSSVAIVPQTQVPIVDVLGAGSSGTLSETRTGWTAGGGVEWMFLRNWSVKLEYLHYDLGGVTYSAGARTPVGFIPPNVGRPVGTNVSTATTSFGGDIVRVGLNYKL
jgi:outer membrane immunogenic protein